MKFKIAFVFLFGLSTLILFNCKDSSQEITAMTYNIRYNSPHDGENIWEFRKEGLVRLLENNKPDVIGTQEGLKHQLDFIKSKLSSYKMIGVDRDKNGKSEFSSIFYNTNSLTLINSKTFWLSPTPTLPTIGWGASFKRICTYGEFKTKSTGERFLVFNTHFDHMGERARLESALLINKKITALNSENLPVILMGDLNCVPDSNPILALNEVVNDALTLSESELKGPIGTFSGFDKNAPLDKRIDYIFTTNFKVKSYSHIDSKIKNGNWPSDHLPVVVKLILSK